MGEPRGRTGQVALADGGRTGQVALADGGRVAYEVRGAGPPLLLCRWGFGAMAMWHELAAGLAPACQVIAFDPRGTGASSRAPLWATTRTMARDALAVLDALAVPAADVFGESLGGMAASWLAIDAPARVRRLVLSSTLPEATTISTKAITDGWAYARWLLRPAAAATVGIVRTMMGPRFAAAEPARMAAIEAALRRAPSSRRDLLAVALAALRHHPGPALKRVPAPTLLLFGARDPIVGAAARAELVRDRPTATVEILAGAGHALTLERPAEIARRVRGFLAGAPTRA